MIGNFISLGICPKLGEIQKDSEELSPIAIRATILKRKEMKKIA